MILYNDFSCIVTIKIDFPPNIFWDVFLNNTPLNFSHKSEMIVLTFLPKSIHISIIHTKLLNLPTLTACSQKKFSKPF